MAEKQTGLLSTDSRLARREHARDPFTLFERFADGIDRVFDDMGFGRGWAPPFSRQTSWAGSDSDRWSPAIDVFHRGNEFVVHAELPGMKKDDITVDIKDDGICIQGERKRETKEDRDGVYRAERSYGSFYRMIPLPDGSMVDQANAKFKDGVLEITMPAPPEHLRRGRRLEIGDGASSK